jgi:hypothetical protein
MSYSYNYFAPPWSNYVRDYWMYLNLDKSIRKQSIWFLYLRAGSPFLKSIDEGEEK